MPLWFEVLISVRRHRNAACNGRHKADNDFLAFLEDFMPWLKVISMTFGKVINSMLAYRSMIIVITCVPAWRDAPRGETNHRYFEFK